MIYIDRKIETELPSASIEIAAQAALEYEPTPDSDLTIVMAGDEELRRLNKDYLENNVPTDVLSFPPNEIDPDTGRRYLGDVIVSVPRAVEQAGRRNHPLVDEVQLLIIHGILHLLGYDHVEDAEKSLMWEAQAAILHKVGLKINLLDEPEQ